MGFEYGIRLMASIAVRYCSPHAQFLAICLPQIVVSRYRSSALLHVATGIF
jgi:hypothetical protein